MRQIVTIFTALGLLPMSAAAEELPGLAALNLKAQRGVEDDLTEMISEAALSVLRASKRFKSVIGSSDVAAMISAEQQKQALGCDDDSCLAQLGGALGVPYLLTGSLGTLGGRFMLNMKLLAVDEAKVAGRVTKMFDGERALGEGLQPALLELVNDAFGRKSKAESKPPVVAPPTTSKSSEPTYARWAGLSLGVVGAGLSAYSYAHVSTAQNAYDTDPSKDSQDALIEAAKIGNSTLTAGLVSLGAGVGLWWWGR